MRNDTFNAIPVVMLMIMALFVGGLALNYYSKPFEAREAAKKAKYDIEVGWNITRFSANDYTFTNGILSFYDEFTQQSYTFFNKSFTVKTNSVH